MRSQSVVARILRLSASLVTLVATLASAATAQEVHTDSIPGSLVTFEMVEVPRGNNVPSFLIGRTEVTWDMYDAYWLHQSSGGAGTEADAVARPTQPYGAPDYGWGHAGFPVISVTRHAAEAFCEWLSLATGKRYRLPTEAEWERVAALATGGMEQQAAVDSIAWHSGNSNGQTRAVGSLAPDALGLHDLFGNAAEWIAVPGDSNVTRGGSFVTNLEDLGTGTRERQQRSWNERDPQLPKSRWWLSDAPFAGFRLVRDP